MHHVVCDNLKKGTFMFSGLKDKLTGGAKRMAGHTDFLEAVCAAAALVAAADGDIDDSEIAATVKAVASNEVLSAAFAASAIGATIDRMLDRANGGRAGRMGLWNEIEDVATKHDQCEIVLLVAMDIADADGTVDESEQKVLEKVAKTLGLKLADYDV